MAMSALGYAANGVIEAASFATGAVLTGTAAVAEAAGSAGARSGVGDYATAAAKVAAGAAVGAVVGYATGLLVLKAAGFTAVGPASGSYAASWMSSEAIANGGGVAAGSFYSAAQAAAMGSGVLPGAPLLAAAGAVVGAVVGNRCG